MTIEDVANQNKELGKNQFFIKHKRQYGIVSTNVCRNGYAVEIYVDGDDNFQGLFVIDKDESNFTVLSDDEARKAGLQ